MTRIELDGVHYNLPESWDEIDTVRLPKLIELVYLVPESGRLYHTLLQVSLGIRPKAWQKIHQRHFGPKLSANVRRKNAEVLQQIVSMLAWLWTVPMDRQPFTHINVDGAGFDGHSWLLPEPDFMSMSYGELTDVYIHLQAYIQQITPGEEELDYLVATVCRPRRARGYTASPDWNGDHREPYNEFVVRERVKLVTGLPFTTKMAVLLYVASTIKNVMGKYALFDDTAENSGSSGSAGEAYTGQGFIKNQHLLAEKGIFGNMKQTQQANAHEVLLFLEEHRADLLAKQQAQQTADQ